MLSEDGQTKLYFELLDNLVDKNHAYRKVLEIVVVSTFKVGL